MNSTIGKRIKQLRKELKMTQAELAEPKMTKSMLSHIENGHANPSMKNLQYIAKRLKKPVSYFLQEDSVFIDDKDQNHSSLNKILDKLTYIDDLIKEKKYELAKNETKSLLSPHSIEKSSKIYADILYRLAFCDIKLSEFEEAEKSINICCKVYIDNKLYVDAVRMIMRLLYKHLERFEYKQSEEILNRAYELYSKSSSKDVFLEIELLLVQPAIYFAKGDFEKTINVCKEAIALSNESNIYYLLDDAYRMMAITYLLQGNLEKFVINIDKSKKYLEFTNNKHNLVKIFHNYAKYHNMINNPSEALKYLELLDINSDKKTFYYYVEHGKAEYLLGNYDRALKDLLNITNPEKIHYLIDYIYIFVGKIYKGLIYSKLEDLDQAIKEIEDAINEIKPYTKIEYVGFVRYAYKELSFAYESLSEIYSLKGDYEMAYISLRKSNKTKVLSKK